MAMDNKEALTNFSKKIENHEVDPKSTDDVVVDGKVNATPEETSKDEELDDMLDDAVIVGMNKEDVAKADTLSEGNEETTITERWQKMIREQMADMANRNPDEFNSQSDRMIKELLEYRKSMMIDNGFTAEEADRAANKRLARNATEANTQFLKENPNLAVVTIDKSNADKLEFSDEEKQKLIKTKAIKLVEVEDAALSSIKIKTAPSDDVFYKAIHRVTCNVSKYDMPMINTYDNCEFTGATTMQLVQAVYDENDSDYRKTQAQLELVYTKFEGSTTLDKYGPDGQVILTKDDFAKWFRYYDLSAALYSIYVASSTEMITSQFVCTKDDGGCGENYNFSYNCKSLINYDIITDAFKEDLDNILANHADREALTELKSKNRTGKRFKSFYTNNIYDISNPSVARALNVLRYVNPKDQYAKFLSNFAMMIENIYVYDPDDGQYYQIKSNDAVNIMRFMYDINDTEFKLLTKEIEEFAYVPRFLIKTKCDKCGKERTSEFRVDELVFLRSEGIAAEIV